MHEMKREITYSQVRSDLKVDMAEIAHFFQDCVLVQSETIGKGVDNVKTSHTAWFLSSWQIEVKRYPEFMEEITVRTWPHDFKGMYGYRNFDIIDSNGKELARANSIWIFMDLEKMRPAKPTEEDIKGYDIEKALDMEYAPRKIKVLEDAYKVQTTEETAVVVKHTFLDSNDHVNNGRYVEEAMDYLPAGQEIRQMRVDYRKAATLGDKMYPSLYEQNGIYQVVFSDKEGSPFVIIEVM